MRDFKVIRSQNKNQVRNAIARQFARNEFNRVIGYSEMCHGSFVQSMRKMVRMKEIADQSGVSIAIFFRGPSGARYVIDNIES